MPETDLRTSFFPKRKVRLELTDWYPLQSSKDEKRVRMDMMIPLTGDNLEGLLPPWIFDPLNSMTKEGSLSKKDEIELVLDGMTLEYWATNKSPERMQMSTGATLGGFSIKKVTRDKDEFPALVFNTTVKANKSFVGWCWEHMGGYLWCEFTPTEPELPAKPPDSPQLKLDTPAEVEEMLERDRVEESNQNIKQYFGTEGMLDSEVEQYLREHLDDDPLLWPEGSTVEQCERILAKLKLEAEASEQASREELTAQAQAAVRETPIETMAAEIASASESGTRKAERAARRPRGFNKPTNPSVN